MTEPHPRSLRRAVLALAALALAACARDLAVPPLPGAPVLSGVAPAAAFSGELVILSGGPFDPDPAGNQVTFPGGAARAEAVGPGELAVRVPPDAGDGPLTVTTAAGTSAPSPAFRWKGPGQLRGTSITATAALAHRPRGVHVAGAGLWIESGLLSALVNLGSPFPTQFDAVPAGPGHATAGGGAIYYAVGSELRRMVPGFPPAVTATAAPCDAAKLTLQYVAGARGAFAGDQVVAMCERVFGSDPTTYAIFPAVPQAGGWSAIAGMPTALSLTLAGQNWQLRTETADSGDGRLAVTAVQPDTSLLGVVLVDFGASPPTIERLHAPPTPGALFIGPTAAGLTAAGVPVVAAAIADRRIALLGQAAPSQLLAAYDPRFTRNADALAMTAGGTIVAWSLEDGLVVGIPVGAAPAAARVQWGYPVTGAVSLRASGGVVWVASDASEEVVALDELTGSVVARRGSRLRPVGLSCYPARPGFGGADVVTTAEVDLGSAVDWVVGTDTLAGNLLEVAGRGRILPNALGADPVLDRVWVAGSVPIAPAYVLASTGGELAADSDHAITSITPVSDGSLVLSSQGVGLVSASGWHELLALPDFVIWVAPAVAADGRILLGHDSGAPVVQLWQGAALRGGGTPDLSPGAGGLDVAALLWLDGQPWVLSGPNMFHAQEAYRIAPDGTLVDRAFFDLHTSTLPVMPGLGLVASPNGRTVARANPAGRGVLIHAADPRAGFPVLAAADLDGEVVGLAFDATGERLFVATRAPARIYQVE